MIPEVQLEPKQRRTVSKWILMHAHYEQQNHALKKPWPGYSEVGLLKKSRAKT